MAGKRDNAVIAVISDLTKAQSARLLKEIIQAKSNIAPQGRGTVATGKKEDVGALLQSGRRKSLKGGK